MKSLEIAAAQKKHVLGLVDRDGGVGRKRLEITLDPSPPVAVKHLLLDDSAGGQARTDAVREVGELAQRRPSSSPCVSGAPAPAPEGPRSEATAGTITRSYASTRRGAPTVSHQSHSSNRALDPAAMEAASERSSSTRVIASASAFGDMSRAYSTASPASASVWGSLCATTGAPADMYSITLTKLVTSFAGELVSGATHTAAWRTSRPRTLRSSTHPSHAKSSATPRLAAKARARGSASPSPATTTCGRTASAATARTKCSTQSCVLIVPRYATSGLPAPSHGTEHGGSSGNSHPFGATSDSLINRRARRARSMNGSFAKTTRLADRNAHPSSRWSSAVANFIGELSPNLSPTSGGVGSCWSKTKIGIGRCARRKTRGNSQPLSGGFPM